MPATDTDGNVVKGKKAYPLRQLVAQGFIEFSSCARQDRRSTTNSRFRCITARRWKASSGAKSQPMTSAGSWKR